MILCALCEANLKFDPGNIQLDYLYVVMSKDLGSEFAKRAGKANRSENSS